MEENLLLLYQDDQMLVNKEEISSLPAPRLIIQPDLIASLSLCILIIEIRNVRPSETVLANLCSPGI